MRQAERDESLHPGSTTAEQQRIKALERENRELRQTNEILKADQHIFRQGGARAPHQEVMAFIDAQREHFGVELDSKALQIAPSSYWRRAARQRNPALLPARAQRDAVLIDQVQRVHSANLQVYGYRKVWRQMRREGPAVARCTVQRLMRLKGLQGARRGKRVRTTVPGSKAPCPLGRMNRQFKTDRPNQP